MADMDVRAYYRATHAAGVRQHVHVLSAQAQCLAYTQPGVEHQAGP